MPYSPKFTITNQLLKNIASTEAAREVIENAPLVPAWERNFKEEAVVRSVHYSTHIEGNPLEIGEVKKIVDGREDEVAAGERDFQEIINYRQAMDFMDRAVTGEKKIDVPFICGLHEILANRFLSPDRAGKFRQSKAESRRSQTWDLAFVYPYAEDEIASALTSFVDWLSSGSAKAIHPVLKAGIVQHELVHIHPFDDLNGRVARLVCTFSLFLDGYDIKSFFSLEEYYDKNLSAYYQALRSIEQLNPDLTEWLEYFTLGLAQELTRIKERVLHLSRDQKLKKAAGQVRLNERQEKIVGYIEDYGFVSNKDWQKLFPDVSDDSILRDLKDLIDKKIVKKKGSTKAAYYELRS